MDNPLTIDKAAIHPTYPKKQKEVTKQRAAVRARLAAAGKAEQTAVVAEHSSGAAKHSNGAVWNIAAVA